MNFPTFRCENILHKEGFSNIAGIDEAGRGPLAGPVVAAAVILSVKIKGLNDSKLLSPEKREALYKIICTKAVAVGVGIISHLIVDRINIYRATLLAMQKAVENLGVEPDYLLIDGKIKIDSGIPQKFIVGGDRKSFSIAAASIIAKVTRDNLMREFHEKYPQYGFDRHKGYGTKLHLVNLRKFGLSPIHRRSFAPCKIS